MAENVLINRSIESLDWPKLFFGKDVHEQSILFKKTILNIFHNFIPNKLIICDDCDDKDAPWMNDEHNLKENLVVSVGGDLETLIII